MSYYHYVTNENKCLMGLDFFNEVKKINILYWLLLRIHVLDCQRTKKTSSNLGKRPSFGKHYLPRLKLVVNLIFAPLAVGTPAYCGTLIFIKHLSCICQVHFLQLIVISSVKYLLTIMCIGVKMYT